MEYYGHENPFPWIANLDYRAVRFANYKYLRWIRQDDADELYDLAADPYEMRNLADDASHADVVSRARDVMSSLVLKSLGLPTTSPM